MNYNAEDTCPVVAGATTPASPDELAKLATDVASMVSEYRSLNGEINNITTDLLDEAARLESKSNDELIPRLAQMQSLLSQRGELRQRLKRDELSSEVSARLLGQIEELPGWTMWYENYHTRVKNAFSLRTAQRNLAKINKTALLKTNAAIETSEVAETGETKPDESAKEQSHDGCGLNKPIEREEIKTGPELLASHASMMLSVLTGPSIKSDTMRIKRSVELVKDMQQAIQEGKLFSATPQVDPQPSTNVEPLSPPTERVSPAKLEHDAEEIIRLAVESSEMIVDIIAPTINGSNPGKKVIQNAIRIMTCWQQLHPEEARRSPADAFSEAHLKAVPASEIKPKASGAPRSAPSKKTGRSGTDGDRKPVESITADGVTVAPGFTCKFNGQDCKVAEVIPGADLTVSLIRLSDSTPVGAGPISVRELRFVTDPVVSRAG